MLWSFSWIWTHILQYWSFFSFLIYLKVLGCRNLLTILPTNKRRVFFLKEILIAFETLKKAISRLPDFLNQIWNAMTKMIKYSNSEKNSILEKVYHIWLKTIIGHHLAYLEAFLSLKIEPNPISLSHSNTILLGPVIQSTFSLELMMIFGDQDLSETQNLYKLYMTYSISNFNGVGLMVSDLLDFFYVVL
jgi:hypothetical protein